MKRRSLDVVGEPGSSTTEDAHMSLTRVIDTARRLVPALAFPVIAFPAAALAQGSLNIGPGTRSGEPRFQGGAALTIAQPVGQFGQYVDEGFGVGVHGLFRLGAAGAFALRADGSFVQYGRETKRVILSPTVGGRIRVDLTTSNNIAWFGVGPQLMAPSGPVRPYVNGAVGFSYFATQSSLEAPDGDDGVDRDYFRNTNYDDFQFSYGGGAGVLIPVARGARNIFFIDVGARFHNNGRASYLREGGIEDLPNGDVVLHPINSTANLWTYHIGVSIGGR
jgi:hypothetical protein